MAVLFTLLLLIGSLTGVVSFVPISSSLDASTSDVESLYETVLSYDFANGRSQSLEDDIKYYIEKSSTTNDNDATAHNIALKAKIIYYYNIYKNHTVLTALKELEDYQFNQEDAIFLADYYTHAYRALGNTKLADEYQAEYENLTRKCGE